MTKTLADLHDHLKKSGTGAAKLALVLDAPSMRDALLALRAQSPGTFAKAESFLGSEIPVLDVVVQAVEAVKLAPHERVGNAAYNAALETGKTEAEAGEIARKASALIPGSPYVDSTASIRDTVTTSPDVTVTDPAPVAPETPSAPVSSKPPRKGA